MDQHEAHAEAIRSNNLLLKGTYEDGYKAGFKAGREAGMREAAKIAEKEEEAFMADSGSKDLNDHYAACASGAGSAAVAILSAIGGDK